MIVAPNISEPLSSYCYYLTPLGDETREQLSLSGIKAEKLDSDLKKLLVLPEINTADLSAANYFGMLKREVQPAYEKAQCTGPFFLLIDSGTASAAEGFAMFCKNTGFATIVGENSGGDGDGGTICVVKLPKSGLLMRFRTTHTLNPDGSSNPEFGTTPDVTHELQWGKKDISYLGVCLDYIKDHFD